MYLTGLLLNFFVTSTVPLFYELGVETAYPIAEGVATGFLTMCNNIFSFFFLLLPILPGLGGTKYMVVAYNIGILISIILMLFYRET